MSSKDCTSFTFSCRGSAWGWEYEEEDWYGAGGTWHRLVHEGRFGTDRLTDVTACEAACFIPWTWDDSYQMWRHVQDISITDDSSKAEPNADAAIEKLWYATIVAYNEEQDPHSYTIDRVWIEDSGAPIIAQVYYRQSSGGTPIQLYPKGTGSDFRETQNSGNGLLWDNPEYFRSGDVTVPYGPTALYDIIHVETYAATGDYQPASSRAIIEGLVVPGTTTQIPSLSQWLYFSHQAGVIEEHDLRVMQADTIAYYNSEAAKRGYGSQNIMGNVTSLSQGDFTALQKELLNEEQEARLLALAQEMFKPWYESVTAAQSENEEAYQEALAAEIEPIIQDAEMVSFVIERYEEESEERAAERLPYYIAAGVLTIGAGAVGYKIWKKRGE